jgi:hypothetical protein
MAKHQGIHRPFVHLVTFPGGEPVRVRPELGEFAQFALPAWETGKVYDAQYQHRVRLVQANRRR